MKTHLEPFCFVSGAAGIYVPRSFARKIDHNFVEGVTLNSWATLENGPDDEAYWVTWSNVLDNAVLTDKDGNKWTLYQDGDLFCIPVGMEWDDEAEAYVWPEE